jgi:hypothetical protein
MRFAGVAWIALEQAGVVKYRDRGSQGRDEGSNGEHSPLDHASDYTRNFLRSDCRQRERQRHTPERCGFTWTYRCPLVEVTYPGSKVPKS